MKPFYVDAIDILAPGLVGWEQASAVLRGEAPFVPGDLPPFPTGLMNSNEKRRTTALIRLTLQVMDMLSKRTKIDFKQTLTVFSSSEGDLNVMDIVCDALATPGIPISPVQFHNVVHNAAAGYWSITAGQTAPSVSISARDGSYAAGLIEAYTNIVNGPLPVAFLSYDHPPPSRLMPHRPIVGPFSAAILVTREQTAQALCALSLEIVEKRTEDTLEDPQLESLRLGNPSARGLPLLALIARGIEGRVTLPYLDDLSVVVHVNPLT